MMTQRMACCYFPTTVLFIDDNRRFLSRLQLVLDLLKMIPRVYDNPFHALDFIANEYYTNSFIQRCLLRPEENHPDHRYIDVDVRAIHREIYNAKRFNEISVIVIDYAMPGINGLEWCERLGDHRFKIILLTGEADEKMAIQAFNNDIIHRFIRKDDPNFVETLNKSIHELQHSYFKDLSEIVINSLTQNPEYPISCLNDTIFITFFNDFCKQHSITEYYLTEATGSFLFLNNEGFLGHLLVKDEEAMDAACFEAEVTDSAIPTSVLSSLKSREKLFHCYPPTHFPQNAAEWSLSLHPANKLEGRTDYYYSHVTAPNAYAIQLDNIYPYKSHLNSFRNPVKHFAT